jgi:ubiquinone/menaquinone biosynthesis C-methylase UbiE
VRLGRALIYIQNVEIIEADARYTGLPDASFDLVHARTLLVNNSDPGSVLTEMARLVRPGGWVMGMEPDAAGRVYYPPNPFMDRLHEIFGATYLQDGADPSIGRRLPSCSAGPV